MQVYALGKLSNAFISFFRTSLNDLAQELAPYFQLDFLMPRTLVTTFYVKDLNNLNILGFPEDAVLASLYYHILSTRYISTHLIMVRFNFV